MSADTLQALREDLELEPEEYAREYPERIRNAIEREDDPLVEALLRAYAESAGVEVSD